MRKWLQWRFDDLFKDTADSVGIEGFLEGDQLIEDNTHCPNVSLTIIGFTLAHFWRHKVRCTARCHSHWRDSLYLFRDTEITNLEDVILCDKDVLCLDIPVKDIFTMHRHYTECHLCHVAEALVGRKLFTLYDVILNFLCETAAISIFHHNVDDVILDKGFNELNQGGTLEHTEELYFIF